MTSVLAPAGVHDGQCPRDKLTLKMTWLPGPRQDRTALPSEPGGGDLAEEPVRSSAGGAGSLGCADGAHPD